MKVFCKKKNKVLYIDLLPKKESAPINKLSTTTKRVIIYKPFVLVEKNKLFILIKVNTYNLLQKKELSIQNLYK